MLKQELLQKVVYCGVFLSWLLFGWLLRVFREDNRALKNENIRLSEIYRIEMIRLSEMVNEQNKDLVMIHEDMRDILRELGLILRNINKLDQDDNG